MDSCGHRSAFICGFAAQFSGYTSAENPILFLFFFSVSIACGFVAAIYLRQLLASNAVAAEPAGLNVTQKFSQIFLEWGEVESLSFSQRTKRDSSLLISLANGKTIRVLNVQADDAQNLINWAREKELTPPARASSPRAT